MSSSLAVRRAVRDRLTNILGCPVYDRPPDDADFPFVDISAHVTVPIDTVRERYDQVTLYLAVWSAYRGHREVSDIMARIAAGLHEAALPLENGVCVSCRVASRRADLDADGVTYQGAVEVRVIVKSE
jgi:hypothetical protein